MATAKINLPDDLMKNLLKLGENTGKVLTSTLEAGGAVVLDAARSNLNRSVTNSSLRSTGELQSSLGLSPVKVNRAGNHNVKVGFAEPRQAKGKGMSYRKADGSVSQYEYTNAMVANILEHGSRANNQQARPFMRPARLKSRKPAETAMTEKFDSELKKLGVV